MPPPEVEDGDLLIARLWRWDEDRLEADAKAAFRDQVQQGIREPECLVSVWGMDKNPDITPDELSRTLCRHILEHRTAKWIAFTTGSQLLEESIGLRLDEPPPYHFHARLGTDMESANYQGLARLFSEGGARKVRECL